MDMLAFLEKVDETKATVFPMRLSGRSTCATKKHLANISMAFPKDVVENISDLDKHVVFVIAIDRDEYKRVVSEEEVCDASLP